MKVQYDINIQQPSEVFSNSWIKSFDNWILPWLAKGQLISKANFKVFIWTKKQTKNFCPVFLKVGQKFFVRFLVQMKTLKFPFDIYWPLAVKKGIKNGAARVVKYKQASMKIFQNYRKQIISIKNLLYLLRINYWF